MADDILLTTPAIPTPSPTPTPTLTPTPILTPTPVPLSYYAEAEAMMRLGTVALFGDSTASGEQAVKLWSNRDGVSTTISFPTTSEGGMTSTVGLTVFTPAYRCCSTPRLFPLAAPMF